MKMGFAKVTDQENAKLDLSVYIQLVVQSVLLASTWLYIRFYGIFVVLVIVLHSMVFSLWGEKCSEKATDVDYNCNAPQISFVYFIMLMNIIILMATVPAFSERISDEPFYL